MFPLYGGVDLGLTKVHHIPPLPKPVDSQPLELLPCALRIFCLPGYLGFQRGTTNITRRAQRAAVDKQRTFSPEDVGPALSGKADIGEQVSLWTQLQLLLLFATLASRLNSHFAHLAQLCLIVKGRWRALWREIPRPTTILFSWAAGLSFYVKARPRLVERSTLPGFALCVN